MIRIFDRIALGLNRDYTDPNTKQIWGVEDYLAGETQGVRVYTNTGRYLGTAYRNVSDALERKGG